jgi:hypothetical protein
MPYRRIVGTICIGSCHQGALQTLCCGWRTTEYVEDRSWTGIAQGWRLIEEQNTHQQVKAKILERMAEWTEMFKRDPDLGIMEQAYMKLKSQSTTPKVNTIAITS